MYHSLRQLHPSYFILGVYFCNPHVHFQFISADGSNLIDIDRIENFSEKGQNVQELWDGNTAGVGQAENDTQKLCAADGS